MAKYNLTARKLIKILNNHSFHFIRQNGSHALNKNFRTNRKVIVPIHNKDIPKGTVKAILRDADINI
ncbi:type II toxin-antitoxin system HicA family toxin [Patescibacteria group bacterium]